MRLHVGSETVLVSSLSTRSLHLAHDQNIPTTPSSISLLKRQQFSKLETFADALKPVITRGSFQSERLLM